MLGGGVARHLSSGRGAMLRDVIGFLRCPHCEADVSLREGSVCCSDGRRFDVARQGYVNLLPGDAQAETADTPEMVATRMAFFETGPPPNANRAALIEAPTTTVPRSSSG